MAEQLPTQSCSRIEHIDIAEIVIVREKRFCYRWTFSLGTGSRRRQTGTTWTAWGARQCAVRCLHNWGGTIFGRLDREEFQIAVRSSHKPSRNEVEVPPLEMLDG